MGDSHGAIVCHQQHCNPWESCKQTIYWSQPCQGVTALSSCNPNYKGFQPSGESQFYKNIKRLVDAGYLSSIFLRVNLIGSCYQVPLLVIKNTTYKNVSFFNLVTRNKNKVKFLLSSYFNIHFYFYSFTSGCTKEVNMVPV